MPLPSGALLRRGSADADCAGNALLHRRVEIDLVAHELGEREGELQPVDGDALGKFLHGELQLFFDLQQLRLEVGAGPGKHGAQTLRNRIPASLSRSASARM